MASNKKPSIYSDRGGIGSAEDLDEYGVWVKSEPQDMSADSLGLKSGELSSELEEASTDDSLSFDDAVLDVNKAGESSKFEDIEFPDDNIEIDSVNKDFSMDSDFDDINLETGSLGITGDENIEIEDTNFDEFEMPSGDGDNDLANEDLKSDFDDFDIAASQDFGVPTVKAIESNIDNIQGDLDQAAKTKESDLSTHLLKKIADELSSIRGELSELKKEFSSVRAPSADGDKSGFFSEEDDETIALTGDELDNILVNTDEGSQETETEAEPKADTPVMSEGFPLGGDDEDEAIALTGDELDNILNSADFTEESGTNETPENEFEETPDESSEPAEEETPEDTSEKEASASDGLDGLDMDFAGMNDVDLSADFGADDSAGIASDLAVPAEEAPPEETPTEATPSDDIDIESVSFDDSAVTDDGLSLGGETPSEDSLSDDSLSDDIFGSASSEEAPTEETPTEATPSDDIDIESVSFDDSAVTDDSLSLGGETASNEETPSEDGLGDDIFGETALGEPASEETGKSADDEIVDIDIDGLNIDLNPDTILDEQDSSDISLDDDIEIEFDETKDSEELEKLRNDGATPVTFAPENSSYLEEDGETSDLDLSNAVIDEPNLSADGLNDDLTEPSLDTDEFDLDSLSDLTIDDAEISADALGTPADTPTDTSESAPAEEEPVSFDQQFEDDINNIDIDIPADTSEESTPADTQASTPTDTPVAESDSFDIGEDESLSFDDFGSDSFDIANADEEPKEEPQIEESAPAEEPAPVPQAAPAPQPDSAPQAAPAGLQLRAGKNGFQIPSELKSELRNILSYMDQLLESLPEEKIEEFAKSEYFDSYKKLFKDLGLV